MASDTTTREESQSPVDWEDVAAMTMEQVALTDLANHLQTHVSNETILDGEDDVRQEAELLMSLLSSCPIAQKLSFDEEVRVAAPNSERSERTDATRGGFSFTCPTLSLDPDHPQTLAYPVRKVSDSSDESAWTYPLPPPASLLARPLVVEDPDALRLSSTSVARNVLRTFQKALEWRFQMWANSLSRILVQKETELREKGASDVEIRELLDTSEAKVISSLRIATSRLDVMDARTTFRVMSQRVNHFDCSTPPEKKQRLEESSNLSTESDYTYRVSHALNFETVVNINTPAGYAEITVEAPGIIEGTFLSSSEGEDYLTSAVIHLDTHVLATMIERSTRVVARSAAEATMEIMEQEATVEEHQEEPELTTPTKEHLPSPKPCSPNASGTDGFEVAVVTPRRPSPPSPYCSDSDYEVADKPGPSLPQDLDDGKGPRMVSPQPRSPELVSFKFAPRTPSKSRISGPSLVSPQPLSSTSLEPEDLLCFASGSGPSLPALVEVACAARRAN